MDLVNKVRRLKPSILTDTALQLIESLDLDGLSDSLAGWGNDIGGVTLPLERIVVPKMVKAVCRALAPRDDDYGDEAAEARDMLRELLMREEVYA
jgi:hypothetical protein